jgi:ribosomal protein L29
MLVSDLAACAVCCRNDVAQTKAELLVLRLVVQTGQDEAAVCVKRIPLGERRLSFLEEELADYRAELVRRQRGPN